MINKLMTASVLSVVLSISAVDAMNPTWGDLPQTSKFPSFLISFSQITGNQTNFDPEFAKIQRLSEEFKKALKTVNKDDSEKELLCDSFMRMTPRSPEENSALFSNPNCLDILNQQHTDIVEKMTPESTLRLYAEHKNALERCKKDLSTQVKDYVNRKLLPFESRSRVDEDAAVQILKALELMGYAYVRKTEGMPENYFDGSVDFLLQDQPISYRITDEVDDQFGFELRDCEMYKL